MMEVYKENPHVHSSINGKGASKPLKNIANTPRGGKKCLSDIGNKLPFKGNAMTPAKGLSLVKTETPAEGLSLVKTVTPSKGSSLLKTPLKVPQKFKQQLLKPPSPIAKLPYMGYDCYCSKENDHHLLKEDRLPENMLLTKAEVESLALNFLKKPKAKPKTTDFTHLEPAEFSINLEDELINIKGDVLPDDFFEMPEIKMPEFAF